MFWEFPGGPVVRTQHFHCPGSGSIPGRGTKIPKAERGTAKIMKQDMFFTMVYNTTLRASMHFTKTEKNIFAGDLLRQFLKARI